jgi:hypothetical protein
MVFVIPAYGNTELDTSPDAPTFLRDANAHAYIKLTVALVIV